MISKNFAYGEGPPSPLSAKEGGGRMAGMENRPGFWAVLPAEVRYDKDLPASAKLLYAEISSLSDQLGYC